MTTLRFLVGLPLLAVVVVPLGIGAHFVRRRLLPGWGVPIGPLCDLVIGLSAVTVASEALGSIGAFALGPLMVTCVLLGGLAALWARQPTSPRPPARVTKAASLWTLGLAGIGILLTAGSWAARTLAALRDGMTSVDTNWYHLPFALSFVQSRHTGLIRAMDPDAVTAYFPATGSLLHAIGMLAFDTDLVSTVMNLGWLAVAVLAAWCIGDGHGVAPGSAVAATILLAGPGMVDTQPGGALTDVFGVALLLAMVAIGFHTRPGMASTDAPALVVAGLAGGLATGAKFTFLLPVVLVALALVVCAPVGRRVTAFAGVAVAGLISGGYWYGRNLVLTGNPLPALDAGVWVFHLHAVDGVAHATAVRSILFERSAWSDHMLPGLRDAYGPAWVVSLALAAIGIVGAMVAGPSRQVRVLGVVAALSLLGFVYTPQYLYGGVFFATNLRYAAPGLVLGLVLAPVVLRRWPNVVLALSGSVLIVTQLDPTSWPVGFGGPSFFSAVGRRDAFHGAILVVIVTVAAGVWWTIARRTERLRLGAYAAAGLIPVVMIGGLALGRERYLDRRYDRMPPFAAANRWAQDLHGQTIGLYGGFLAPKYPFAGNDLSNRVRYLAVPTDNGGFRPPANCGEWVDLLESERLDRVLVLERPGDVTGAAAWTRAQPDAQLERVFPVGSDGALEVQVFSLNPMQERRC